MLTGKIFLVVFLFCILPVSTNAQSGKATFTPIFEDLPIDDPAKNSEIKGNETPTEKIRKNIFVTATLTKSKCYLGEPILLTYKLYSSLQSRSTIQKRPSLLGFIVSEISSDNSVPEYKKVDGKNYRTFTIQQLQLISVKEGPVTIDPVVVENNIHYKKDNGQTDQYSGLVSGGKLDVMIEPLPLKGRPTTFAGSVGSFTVSAVVKSDSFPSNQNNVLEITIQGTGNFGNFAVPDVEWPAGIEPYSSHERSHITQSQFPNTGSKYFSIPFTAKVGTYTIPPVAIAFFDPSRKSYIAVQSQAVQIKALPPAPMPSANIGKVVHKRNQIPIYYWWISGAVVLIIIILIIFKWRKTTTVAGSPVDVPEPLPAAPEEELIDYRKEIDNISTISDAKEYLLSFKVLLIEYLRTILGNEKSLEEKLLMELRTLDMEMGDLAGELCDQCNFLLYTSESFSDSARLSLKEKFLLLIDKANNIGS